MRLRLKQAVAGCLAPTRSFLNATPASALLPGIDEAGAAMHDLAQLENGYNYNRDEYS